MPNLGEVEVEASRAFLRAIRDGDVNAVKHYIAVYYDNYLMINVRVQHSANPQSINPEYVAEGEVAGLTPLMYAINCLNHVDENNRQEIIDEILTHHSTDVNAQARSLFSDVTAQSQDLDFNTENALILAVRRNDSFTLNKLVYHPYHQARASLTDGNGMSALNWAERNHNSDFIEILREAELWDNPQYPEEVLQMLERANQEANVVVGHDPSELVEARTQTAHLANEFIQAITSNNISFIERYLNENRNNVAALNIVDEATGDTALIIAARLGNSRLVQELLRPGLNIETRNLAGFTAAEEAARAQHHDIARDITLLVSDRQQEQAQNPAPPPAPASSTGTAGTATPPPAKSFQQRLDDIEYDERIPAYLLDNITQSTIINDPLTLPNGITYDRQSLLRWFAEKGNPATTKCPVTNIQIKLKDVQTFETSITLKGIADDFVLEKEKAHKLSQSKQTVSPQAEEKEQKEKMIKARLSYFKNDKKSDQEEEEEEEKPKIKKP